MRNKTGWGCSSPSAKIPVLTQKNASLLIAIQHWAWQNQHVYSIWRENGRAFAATITLHAMLREQLPMTDTQRRPVHLLQVSLSHVLSEAFLPQEMRSRQHYILPAAPILEPIDPSDRAHAEHSVGLPYYARGPPAVCTTRTLTSGPRLNQLGCGIRKSRSLK